MSTKADLQQALTDFDGELKRVVGIARDERSRVESALHGLLTAVAQLPEPVAEPTPDPEPKPDPVEKPRSHAKAKH